MRSDGTLAPTRLDIDFHVRHSIRTVSAVVLAGVRLGERAGFSDESIDEPSTPNRDELAADLRRMGRSICCGFGMSWMKPAASNLAPQIAAIDFEQIAQLFQQGAASHDWAALARRADAAAGDAAWPIGRRRDDGALPMRAKRGVAALAAGKIGVLLVAGGQGSRLGFEHPKGMYSIGPVSRAHAAADSFRKSARRCAAYGAAVPIYMMTSPVTHDEQVEFLDEHDRFGLPADDVVLFCQGTMPAVDATTGKLLLAEKDSLFLSPDGHGGTVAALAASGAIEHMRRRGIEHLFYLQVDNPLTPIGDPEFIGYHLLAESELTSMAVAKQTPQDRLGVFVVDRRPRAGHRIQRPSGRRGRRADADGSLEFWAGSIAVHMFSVSFLERALALKDALPFHIAHKKVPHHRRCTVDRVEPKRSRTR